MNDRLGLFINSDKRESNIFNLQKISKTDIAITGVSVKVPDASDIGEFWSNLENGAGCIKEIPESRRTDICSYLSFLQQDTDKVKFKNYGYLDNIDSFDYNFFGIAPKEASLMDPNQRLFLQEVYNVIEDAGYDPKKLAKSKTGVYVGFSGDSEYKTFISQIDPGSSLISMAGNIKPIIASRISYILDLRGPSMVVDTTCSSSLVALHLACRAIRSGDCDMAIAGGVKICYYPFETAEKMPIESSDGKTRSFDDDSDGTGFGEGVLALFLKPLNRALDDGDQIYAVIKGSSINQDGRSMGITAPNPEAQEQVIINAWKDAAISPETITYIEAHGTGTKLGDPIEVEGINNAFRHFTQKKQFCAIGSVKSNIGHLDTAAGVAGLVKAVLALKHGIIPPSINFRTPNKMINFNETAVYVNSVLRRWDVDGCPRRCGVSSFGLSGTNCHVVLEEAPEIDKHNNCWEENNILVISARSMTSLYNLVTKYKKFIASSTDLNIRDLCYTASTCRSHFEYRLAIPISTYNELVDRINKIHNQFETLIFKSKLDNIYFSECNSNAEESNLKQVPDLNCSLSTEANNIVDKILENDTFELYGDLCELYVKGAEIDWERLYTGENLKKVRIPVYSFDKVRCWPEVKGNSVNVLRIPSTSMEEVLLDTSKHEGVDCELNVKISEVWKNVLGINVIGMDDDFFKLGGHSLLAIKLQVELEKQGIFFEEYDIESINTISKMCDYLKQLNN